MNRYVIISGVPASGKSTLARTIAEKLSLPLFDKDDFLESIFKSHGAGDKDSRRSLSRAADKEFRNQAERSDGAVIVSWWKHPLSSSDSGTPIEWLASLRGSRVEVYCRCNPAIAANRFVARRRHPGHLDSQSSYADLLIHFTSDTSFGPLGVGCLVEVETDREIEFDSVLRAIEQGWKTK